MAEGVPPPSHCPRRARRPARSTPSIRVRLRRSPLCWPMGSSIAGTTSRSSRPEDRRRGRGCTPSTTRGICENPAFWPWELCELFNLAAALERARVVRPGPRPGGVRAAVALLQRPVSGAAGAHRPPSAESAGGGPVVSLCRRAIHRRLPRAGARPRRLARRRRGAPCRGDRGLRLPRRSRGLPAVPRPLHRRQGRIGRDRRWHGGPGIACCSRPPRTIIIGSTWRRSSTDNRWFMLARSLTPTRSRSSAARGPWSIRSRPLSRSAWCSPKPPRAARPWPRCAAAPSARSWTTMSRAWRSTRWTTLIAGLPRVLALDRGRVRATAVRRFGVDRMVDGYLALYAALAGAAMKT